VNGTNSSTHGEADNMFGVEIVHFDEEGMNKMYDRMKMVTYYLVSITYIYLIDV
jgi:hypothetical protein